MNSMVERTETLADQIQFGDTSLTEPEKARISAAAHRILNQTEPYVRADVDLVYKNH